VQKNAGPRRSLRGSTRALIRPLRRRSLSMMRGSMQQGWSHFDVGPHFLSRFPTYYNNTQKVKNEDLFRAPTVHCEDPQPRVSEHLAQEARDCDRLVLWLDCDREGEYTCFEVISSARPCLCSTPTLLPDGSGGLPGAWMGNVMRAFFSSLAPADLCHAMTTGLGHPNWNESRSVDARQE